MKKVYILIITILLTPVVAGLYGVLHDQFTYTISHEYYTCFKFHQFGLEPRNSEGLFPHPRMMVAIVGFMATWWTGILIGLGHGFIGLTQKDAKTMKQAVIKATLITMTVTVISGLLGLLYGAVYLSRVGVSWPLPDGLIDKRHFIMVGSMHNFSYLGGAIGLMAGMLWQMVIARKAKSLKW